MSSQEKMMQAGKALYFLNVNNVEIARILEVSQTTVSNWVVKGGWREERAGKMSQRKTIQDSLLNLIDYQLEALTKITEDNRKAGTLFLLDKSDIDALSKMFAGIKGKELTWANVVTVIREIIEYVAAKDPDLAKALIPYTDEFLNVKREGMAV